MYGNYVLFSQYVNSTCILYIPSYKFSQFARMWEETAKKDHVGEVEKEAMRRFHQTKDER